jgi:hypothetical protein
MPLNAILSPHSPNKMFCHPARREERAQVPDGGKSDVSWLDLGG